MPIFKHRCIACQRVTEDLYMACPKHQTKLKTIVSADNIHNGKVRGLLCTNCNRAIGLIGENIESLEKCYQIPEGE